MATRTLRRQSQPDGWKSGLAWVPAGVGGVQKAQAGSWATMMPSDARFGNHFAHGLLIDLLHPLIREFGIALARLDGGVAQ